ncbi:putative integrin cytoplasmic domain-associated protein 1, isoform 1 [Ditylenchus destructor]|nr:putative integrin cytoplasmic domain-associated protein 1, isoform 1 [Ditylenchus destructor]
MAHLTSFEGVHQLHYLGVIDIDSVEQSIALSQTFQQQGPPSVDPHTGNVSPPMVRSVEERIIEKVEHAQLIGTIARRPSGQKGQAKVAVHVSKTGVKFIDVSSQRVVERLALHKIVQAIAYDDGFNFDGEQPAHFNVILVVKRSTFADRGMEQCHLLQTQNAAEADHLCKQIRQAFSSVQADVVPSSKRI